MRDIDLKERPRVRSATAKKRSVRVAKPVAYADKNAIRRSIAKRSRKTLDYLGRR